MKKNYILYKQDDRKQYFIYAKTLLLKGSNFTKDAAEAKKYNLFAAVILGLVSGLHWINEKYTN